MITARWSIRVHRPAEQVFDFVADLRNEPRFNPDAADVRRETPGPVSLGTVYTEHLRGVGSYRTTVDRYERPSQLGFDARNPRTDALVRFRFTPRGERETDVSCIVQLRMRGAMRLLEPPMRPIIRRRIERTRGPMLKQAVESETSGGAT
jgi:hypothetical protein